MIDRNSRTWRDARALYEFLSDCAPRPDHADLLLAAGSHDLRVPEHAARLYRAGAAPLLVCTGGYGKVTDGLFRRPEAEVFAGRCRECGVPDEALILECTATNTGENFTRSRDLLASRGVFPRTGIAVCKPYMARRVWATGTCQWPQVRWYVAVPPVPFEAYLSGDTDPEREIRLMVGDLQRLRVYAERGFQAPVEVPEPVWAAYERLVRDGFDAYVIR